MSTSTPTVQEKLEKFLFGPVQADQEERGTHPLYGDYLRVHVVSPAPQEGYYRIYDKALPHGGYIVRE